MSPRPLAAVVPGRPALVDAGFSVVLTVLAVATLHGSYSGIGYLVVGTVAAVLGAAVAYGCTAARITWLAVPPALALAYLVFGGVLALRNDPRASWAPGPGTVAELARLAVHGWAQLLTTLPPVDGAGPLLVLPLLLGLGGGGATMTVACRTRGVGLPLPVVAAILVTAILLGTGDPGTVTWVGVATALLALAWAGVRRGRQQVSTATGRTGRAVVAAALLAGAGALGALAAPALPGSGLTGRTLLRSSVTPPLNLSAFPSPLAGFRSFRPGVGQYADTTLFTVSGLPAGYRIRIATLDAYNGLVWGVRNDPAAPAVGEAIDTFQHIGTSVSPDVSGPTVTMQVRVDAAYADADDTSGWLPYAGALRSVSFAGPRAAAQRADLRYNLATRTAVVPDRLATGDRITVRSVLDTSAAERTRLPSSASSGGRPGVDPGEYSVVAPTVARLTASSRGSAWQRLLEVATTFRTRGAYTDGGNGEGQFLPGSSAGRIRSFLDADQFAGDDEQYAAVFALVANDLGFPARVVVGAVPAGGVVRGRDVHAWVEVLLRGRGWTTVPTDVFTPPTDRHPQQQPVQEPDDSSAAVVPPPNAVRPPSDLDQLTQSGSQATRRKSAAAAGSSWHLPAFVTATLRWGGPPVGAALLVVALVVGAKALRRRRRRTRGPVGARVAAGWRELLDNARDLGMDVRADMTRSEQASAVAGHDLGELAVRADRELFGGHRLGEEASIDFWADVRRVRRDMLLATDRRRRWRARLSLRSFRALPHR